MAESQGSGAGNWCLIESDPGVFTELIKEFGERYYKRGVDEVFTPGKTVDTIGSFTMNAIRDAIYRMYNEGARGVQVEELWSLDAEQFESLKPIHGLIFLFKWVKDDEPSGSVVQDSRLEKIFFAKQVINNACATQAILSILLNCKHPDLTLGTTLTDFKEFSSSFDASMKGLALSNSQAIRACHNSFASQTLFEFDSKVTPKDNEVYHFVSYIPVDGRLYELDGLKDGPIDLGAIPSGADWLDVVRPIIEKRIKRYNEGEIHFNLMAIVSDRKVNYEQKIVQIQKKIEESGMDTDVQQAEITKLQMLIKHEEAKMARYKVENIRRKHNYLPLIVEILKLLAKDGKLLPLYEKAKEKAIQKASRKEEKKA